jgi:hypothetical protein
MGINGALAGIGQEDPRVRKMEIPAPRRSDRGSADFRERKEVWAGPGKNVMVFGESSPASSPVELTPSSPTPVHGK